MAGKLLLCRGETLSALTLVDHCSIPETWGFWTFCAVRLPTKFGADRKDFLELIPNFQEKYWVAGSKLLWTSLTWTNATALCHSNLINGKSNHRLSGSCISRTLWGWGAGDWCTGAVGFTLCLLPQASEKQVHFVVSRQTRQQTPDLLQETGWSYSAGSSQPCPAERNNPGKVRALLCHPWDRGMGGQLVFHVPGC